MKAMSRSARDPAHVILEAVQLATDADIAAFRRLVSCEPDTLKLDLVLRLLLTYLPESTEPSLYTAFLRDVVSGDLNALDASIASPNTVPDISKHEARRRVRKLHLLTLGDLPTPSNDIPDLLTLFLLNRAYRIDKETGCLPLLQQLLEPFLDHSPYLQKWFISTVLPLLRLDYEYYPQRAPAYSLESFEKLEGRTAVNALLSEAVRQDEDNCERNIGRDLRGLVGPWLYGHTREKRRKIDDGRKGSLAQAGSILPTPAPDASLDIIASPWAHVNGWLLDLSVHHYQQLTQAIEHWDGPGDVDYGGWRNEEDNEDQAGFDEAMSNYGRAGLATIYASQDATRQTYQEMQRVLERIASLRSISISTELREAASSLPAISVPQEYLTSLAPAHLFHEILLLSTNPLTEPSKHSMDLASFLLGSAFILEAWGHPQTVKKILQLALFGTATDQKDALRRVLYSIEEKGNKSDQSWARDRQQLLWLRDWLAGPSALGKKSPKAALGLFSQIPALEMEIDILKALSNNSRHKLVADTYCVPNSKALPLHEVEKALLEVAMKSYDNASNGNRTRGGVKKASDIIRSFAQYFQASNSFKQLDALLSATHALSFYSLTLQHGVPFQPVNIRVQSDPLSLIDKVLKQNPRSYTKLDDLLDIGRNLVRAGLVNNQSDLNSGAESVDRQIMLVQRRIIAKAIEAALAEDDFDTAYSYVITRLSPSEPSTESTNRAPRSKGVPEDDITWQAAYQAGRSSIRSVTGSSELRRLEQRMELLTQALLLAPPVSLNDVLITWRSCEEEMNSEIAKERDEEKQWDDRKAQNPPGGFFIDDIDAIAQNPREPTRAAMNEEAPMGLFDVARGAAAALSKSAFPLRSPNSTFMENPIKSSQRRPVSLVGSDSGGEGSASGADGEGRIRKRDMVSNMVTGGLASGIGWVLGAPSIRQE